MNQSCFIFVRVECFQFLFSTNALISSHNYIGYSTYCKKSLSCFSGERLRRDVHLLLPYDPYFYDYLVNKSHIISIELSTAEQ